MTRARTLIVAAAAVLAWPVAAQDPASRTAAAAMEKKLAAILTVADRPPANRAPGRLQRTTLTEPEVNAYFRVNGPTFMPTGVHNAVLTIDQGGRVRAKALVDLDQALKPKERPWTDPLAWVGGKVEVTAAGTLVAGSGKGRLTIQEATLGAIPVPVSILQQLVSYYSKTPENPAGFNLAEPFELPQKIWSVETTRGQAVIVQ
jgi:hypothetical protein